MPDITLVAFDLAGTTIQDDGKVVRAFTTALSEYGISVSPEQLNRVRGSSKRQAMLRFIPDGPDRAELAERVYAAFHESLARSYREEGAAAVAGATDTFAWLRARGIKVALNTGFDRDITEVLLSALGWQDGMVDAVVSGDEVKHGRPAPDLIQRTMDLTDTASPRNVASVGDTVLDLRAGQAASVRWNIAVLSGAHRREQLEKEPHTHLLPSIADLPGLWPPK